jgi:type II secretory pathway pseudopilin PulG
VIFIGLIALIIFFVAASASAAVYTGQYDKLKQSVKNRIEKAQNALVDHYVSELEKQRQREEQQLFEEAAQNMDSDDTGEYYDDTTYEEEYAAPAQTKVNVIYRYGTSTNVDMDAIGRQNDEYVRSMNEQSKKNLEEFTRQSQQSMDEFKKSGQQGLEEFRKTQEAAQQDSIAKFKQEHGIE